MADVTKRARGRAGQAARRRRLMRTHGLCEMCLAAGLTREAVEVDHITPLARGGLDVDSNTRNLCRPHHLEVTGQQFGKAMVAGERGVSASGRPTGADHPWNAARIGRA